ncbi:MAG TPA: GNAT family N-acetyltransferase [Cryptosporangiaceae bacterium]|nr:GNAT family N-acetyltransferase [Cryptosporangiaceae bacterium]
MAEVFVRPARVEDAAAVARIQLTTWRTAYAAIVPVPVLARLGEEPIRAQWRTAIERPPSTRHRVLVAIERDEAVGFAAAGPAEPDDLVVPDDLAAAAPGGGDPTTTLAVTTLLVEPRWGRRGHGSRLLAATVDLARADGFTSAVTWVLDADVASGSFFGSAGWEPDGTARVLDMDGTAVHETRLVTSLVPD